CHSNAINAEVVEHVINVHLNRILSQPKVIKQIATNVIEELKRKHNNKSNIIIDINSLEKQKAKLKGQQERLLELFLDDQMNSEMLKEKQHQLNQRLQALEDQIKMAQQSNLEETKLPDFDRLKSRLTLIISRFSVYLKEANPEAKNQLMKLLIDSVEITTDKKVKLVRYKIDESLIPQSLKKDWGSFFMPKIHFIIYGTQKYSIDKITTFAT
ncbi:recombinase RecB, partial [Staphylococcus cohnii]